MSTRDERVNRLFMDDVGVDPTTVGEIVNNGGTLKARDSLGVFGLRGSGGTIPATQVGQVLFSVDGSTFTAELPVTADGGWLVSDQGVLIVHG